MSNVGIILPERAANIGNFLVGRLLPFRQKKMVGPFIFIDHMGPADMAPGENLEVGPHPHIGLSTLTYLFEGEITHRDSLGNELNITPGSVNWMTAGKGVVHSERTPEDLKSQYKKLHGLQIWVALPKQSERTEPNFKHIEANQLPTWTEDNIQYKLIAGEFLDKLSPVPVYSDLFLIEIKALEDKVVNLDGKLIGESGIYILEGEIEIEGEVHGRKQIVVADNVEICSFHIKAGSTVYLFGGVPFPEERYIYWNFVSTSKDLIEEAKFKWQEGLFPEIEGESDPVKMPV